MNPYNCYNNHEKIFEKKSNTENENNAYVYLLMKTTPVFEKYIVATLVSAYALRKQKTKNKIIITVTKDIDKKYYKYFTELFDEIYVINYFIANSNFIKNIKYKKWIYLYTKIELFKLTKYKKIVFINSALLPFKNSDYLFNYKTPAGALLLEPFNINNENKFINIHKILCKHNTAIKIKKIKKYENLLEYNNIEEGFIMASLFILEPNINTYKKLKKILQGNNPEYKTLSFENDEYFFSYFFRKKFTFIDSRFNAGFLFNKYPDIDKIFTINYLIKKPFLVNDIKKYIKNPEIKLWDTYKNMLCEDYPKLKQFINNTLHQ